MSEPKIFAELVSETGDILHAAEHGWDAFTRHIPGRRYHQTDSTATPVSTSATEAPMPSIVDKVTTDFHEAATNIHGWISDFEQHLPTLLGDVAKVEQHPIVQEVLKLGETLLPPEIVQSVVGLIQMGAKMAGGAAVAVETPAVPVAAAAPDAPAQTPAPVAG